GLRRFSVTLLLFLFQDWKYMLSPGSRCGGTKRDTSPPVLGSSILITSAPMSARLSVAKGPAPNWENASTLTPSSGNRELTYRPPAAWESMLAFSETAPMSRADLTR